MPLASLPRGVAGHKVGRDNKDKLGRVLGAQPALELSKEDRRECPYPWGPQSGCLSLNSDSETPVLGAGTHLSVPAGAVLESVLSAGSGELQHAETCHSLPISRTSSLQTGRDLPSGTR